MRDGERFERACRLAVRLWPPDPEKGKARRARLRGRYRSLSAWVQEAERSLDAGGGPGEAREARRLARLRRARDRAERALTQPAFHRAVEFAQLHVGLRDVLRLASVSAIAAAALGALAFVGSVVAGVRGTALLAVAALAGVGPVAAYAAVASYPETLAKRVRVGSLAGAPEAVNYMAMSMRLVPALDRAVAFAAAHVQEPLSTRLRRVLWGVYLRSPAGVEESFLRFARDWGEWHEDLKRAFFAVGSAALERTEAGLERALEKARQIAYEGTKARIQEYAASLRGPTTVLFALGVLLPLIIGAMLPLLSLGGLSPALGSGAGPEAGADLSVPIVLAMDVAFPVAAFAYAWRILGNRPGTGAAGEPPRPAARRHTLVAIAVAATAAPALRFAPGPAGSLAPLWILVAAALVYMAPGLREVRRRRQAVARLEAEFPDALFTLGGRVAEGLPVERALQLAAGASRGSEAAALFERIVRRLQTSREGLEEALFGARGVLADSPSRTVHAALRLVLEVSRKDPATAGKAIVDTSVYLRDLRDVDREIRRDLRSVVEAMQSTALLFAPIVLGVTCALYGLLARSFADLVTLGLPPSGFLAAVGAYLLMAVFVITYFSVGVSRGRDPLEVRLQLVRAWPVSMAVFTLAFLVARAGLVP